MRPRWAWDNRATMSAQSAANPFLIESTSGGADHVPVWFMRQAGRSLPEYRRLRANTTMLEACMMPELAAAITMQPVERYGVDAAIFFSDIVVPLHAAGIDVTIVPGVGPVMGEPLRTMEQVTALPELHPEQLEPVAEAARLVRAALPAHQALIGFAGSPFTVASYLVEGGPSRHHEYTKALMYSAPQVWDALMGVLVRYTISFLQTQIAAGANAIQLFDSWVGALDRADFDRYVAPYSAQILAHPDIAAVPRTYFGVGTGELLGSISQLGVSTVGVDWRVPLDVALSRIDPGRTLQGNLDPAMLFADPEVLDRKVRAILDAGQRAINSGARGHIFNLGHGVLPSTDPDTVARVVDIVHTYRSERSF